MNDLSYDACELSAGCPDPAQELLVLGRRPEARVGKGGGGNQRDGAQDRPVVDGRGACAVLLLVQIGEDLVKAALNVLSEQEANV